MHAPLNSRRMPDERAELRQLEETINILREENNAIKRLYKTQVQNSNTAPANINQQPTGNVWQTRKLEQEVGVLRAQLDAKTLTIRQMDAQKVRLELEVTRLKNALQSEMNNNNHRRQPSIRQPTVTFDDTTRVFIPVETNPPRSQSCCIIL